MEAASDPTEALQAMFDRALPQVHGFLLPRCGDASLAEDLTAETFLAAVDALRRDRLPDLTIAWLITVARNKLVDHWRREERDRRRQTDLEAGVELVEEPWDVQLDVTVANDVLALLGPHHRSALTLRYLDGLPVPEVAKVLDRTVHATEALLVRARAAFRRIYETEGGIDA